MKVSGFLYLLLHPIYTWGLREMNRDQKRKHQMKVISQLLEIIRQVMTEFSIEVSVVLIFLIPRFTGVQN